MNLAGSKRGEKGLFACTQTIVLMSTLIKCEEFFNHDHDLCARMRQFRL